MSTTTFDTLEFIEQLKASGVPDEQAKGHVKAFASAIRQVEEGRKDELATRGDIADLKGDVADIKRDMKEMELRMVIKMAGMILASVGMIIGYLRAFPMLVQVVQPPAQEMRQTAPAAPAR
ncbi:MAG: CCDC90 family protein [Magnetococcus sp. YQC-5]